MSQSKSLLRKGKVRKSSNTGRAREPLGKGQESSQRPTCLVCWDLRRVQLHWTTKTPSELQT